MNNNKQPLLETDIFVVSKNTIFKYLLKKKKKNVSTVTASFVLQVWLLGRRADLEVTQPGLTPPLLWELLQAEVLLGPSLSYGPHHRSLRLPRDPTDPDPDPSADLVPAHHDGCVW